MRTCDFCEDPFTPNSGKQRFCSQDCRWRNYRQRCWERRQARRVTP
jgi:hypothetical protein